MPSHGVWPQESHLATALKSLSGTSEVALWPWLGNYCRGWDGKGGSWWPEQWWYEHWKMLLPMQEAPLLPVSAIGKGSHPLLSAMELAGRKSIPDMSGQVRAGCLASQLSLRPWLLCHWFG